MNLPLSNDAPRSRGRDLIRHGALIIRGRRVPVLSGEIQFFRMDPQSWDPALRNLAAAGLPMVATYLSWRRFSTGPDSYDFEGRTDPRLNVRRFLDLCKAHGLWVTMKPGPWICAEEVNGGYPDWLVADKDLQVLDADDRPVMGYNAPFQSPIPSYLHPVYLEHVRLWLKEVDSVIHEYVYPRGPIVLIQLDNEPCMTFHDRMFESDYNEVNVGENGLYAQWLRDKYASIQRLNTAHRRSWASFSEVRAPRELVQCSRESLAEYSDWVEFKERLLVWHVARIGQFHLENGLDEVLFTINYNEHPQISMPNDWRALEAASGMGGFDFYPRMPMDESALAEVALSVNYSRVCNAIPWSPEIMCGTWSFNGREAASGALQSRDFEYLYLSCLAFGLKGMNFYMFADRDNWIDSPVRESGAPGPSLDAVRSVTRLIAEEPRFEAFDRQQHVAVLYYRPHAREAFIMDSAAPGQKVDAGLGSSYKIFKDLFVLLHAMNADPAVADPWVDPARLLQHRMILVPGGPCMDEATLDVLDDYVRRGGTLVWVNGKPDRDLFSVPFSRSHASLTTGGSLRFEDDPGPGQASAGEARSEALRALLESNGIQPEVSPSEKGILTVLHRNGKRAWLFVINPTSNTSSVDLRFRDTRAGRMTRLPGRDATVSIRDSRAHVACPSRSVQVWELES